MKAKQRKDINYLAFCNVCFAPKKFTKETLNYYYKQLRHPYFYCNNCSERNTLPVHIMKIINDL